MTYSFEEKVVLITGGAAGLGRAAAQSFLARGAKVAIVDLDEDKGRQTVKDIGTSENCLFVPADVADADAMEQAVETTVARFGRLDIAYNNAGVELTPNPLADQSEDEFDRVIDVNVVGVFNAMRAEIPALLTAGGGSIINASSGLGIRGIAMQAPYVASKHAVIGLTKAAALEVAGQGVRINSLAIGVIDSPLYQTAVDTTPGYKELIWSRQPMGRIGHMAEVADAVMWLASDRSTYVTGASLVLDGAGTV